MGYNAYITIKGKTTQAGSGTPSPTNIRELVPIGCQANLIKPTRIFNNEIRGGITANTNPDGSVSLSGTSTSDSTDFYIGGSYTNTTPIFALHAGTYTLSGIKSGVIVYLLSSEPVGISAYGDKTFYVDIDLPITGVLMRVPNGATVDTVISLMLNSGSISAPYVPYAEATYGTQIMVNSKRTLLPLTLPLWEEDTVESSVLNKSGTLISRETHSNKKFVFDGTEDWIYDTIAGVRFSIVISGKKTGISNVICSHFKTLQKFENPTFSNSLRGSTAQGTEQTVVFYPAEAIATDLASWRGYLAAQYAAGTPVTIVYELAEAESYTHDPIQFLVDSPWPTIISNENAFIKVSTEPDHPWILPKTDWYAKEDSSEPYEGDYFEAKDYQRIKNNLLCLKDIADTMWPPVPLPSIPNVTVADYAYSNMINALERSLDALANGTFDPGIDARKTWIDNAPGPKAQDLNRIEESCLKIYETLNAQQKVLPRLAFTLGGVQF
nr:MAG TPA: hypothetical protein [Caudoviricetes sp.]